MATDPFDPYTMLGALERNRVSYIVIGGLARVLRGTNEITNDLDICPQNKDENLARLDKALSDLNGHPITTADDRVREYLTDAGHLSIITDPTAIDRGYDGLRRQATREALGHGLRVNIASIPDLIRNLEPLNRALDISLAAQLRDIAGIERSLGRGMSR
jgi:hypothetical protein